MIDVICISTLRRPELFHQLILSLIDNRRMPLSRDYTLTIVLDDPDHYASTYDEKRLSRPPSTLIINHRRLGASASRNIGASSIPKYRRGEYVMFCDDDVYFCPKWDEKMLELAKYAPGRIISGHSHPFNHAEPSALPSVDCGIPLVVSTPHFMMPWSLWDDVGYFCEPGGPGGSEDFDYCQRAKAKGYGFAITEPQVCLHTGITSSSGKPIVGAELVIENNRKLEQTYGLAGKVIYR